MSILNSGSVGIGTTTPTQMLEAYVGNIRASSSVNQFAQLNQEGQIELSNTSGNPSGIIIRRTGAGSDSWYIGKPSTSDNNLVIYNTAPGVSSNVGIGTTSPAWRFQVKIDATNEGHTDATGAWARTSDRRLKKDIVTLNNMLGKVVNLRGVRYNSKTDKTNLGELPRHIGFIAQELETEFPEIVGTDPDGFKSVAYESMTPILTEAIKEQQDIIKKQQFQIDGLKVRLDKLEKK
jgi:hypothetical protein